MSAVSFALDLTHHHRTEVVFRVLPEDGADVRCEVQVSERVVNVGSQLPLHLALNVKPGEGRRVWLVEGALNHTAALAAQQRVYLVQIISTNCSLSSK